MSLATLRNPQGCLLKLQGGDVLGVTIDERDDYGLMQKGTSPGIDAALSKKTIRWLGLIKKMMAT